MALVWYFWKLRACPVTDFQGSTTLLASYGADKTLITTKHDCLPLRSTLCSLTFTISPNIAERTVYLHPRLRTIRLAEQMTLSRLLFTVTNGCVVLPGDRRLVCQSDTIWSKFRWNDNSKWNGSRPKLNTTSLAKIKQENNSFDLMGCAFIWPNVM